jgi:uncharacterized protein YkwD
MPSFKLVTTLIATLAIGALAAPPAIAGTCGDVDVRPAAGNLDAIRAATLCLLNSERAAQGLRALTENDRLTAASDAYADQMVRQRFFGHVSPDGRTLVRRLWDVGYLGRTADWLAGENIAWAEARQATPREVMSGWMGSPEHRDNILEPRFRDVGLGVSLGSPEGGATDAATYTTDFGMVDGTTTQTPRQSRPTATDSDGPTTTLVDSVPAKPAVKRVKKRTCTRGRRLVAAKKGKSVVWRCVTKRAPRR